MHTVFGKEDVFWGNRTTNNVTQTCYNTAVRMMHSWHFILTILLPFSSDDLKS